MIRMVGSAYFTLSNESLYLSNFGKKLKNPSVVNAFFWNP